MLISDWSSDVCSSDLCGHAQKHGLVDLPVNQTLLAQHEMVGRKVLGQKADNLIVRHFGLGQPLCGDVGQRDGARKSVVSGKSVSERVDLGGGRHIKKKH